MSEKPKVAFYWCASCGGCEEAVVDLNEGILDVAARVDIAFWPAAMDFKHGDVAAMADEELAVSFINGAVRTDEQASMARLLRAKSALVVAFGSCAHTGGIPGLANLTSLAEVRRTSYRESPTVDNREGPIPGPAAASSRGLSLPEVWDGVHSLDQLVSVDYYVPGCPPTPTILGEALEALLSADPPPRGSVLAPGKALCDTCERKRSDTPPKLKRLYRPHQIVADEEVCFLEQGIVCCGPATRSGCGGLCVKGNMPCTGCFGPPAGVTDQGAALLTAVAARLDADTAEQAQSLAAGLVDPAGTLYRYSVPSSALFKCVSPREPE